MEKTNNESDRRKYIRIKKELVTYFEVINSDDGMSLAGKMKSQDISMSGMLIEGSEPLDIGSLIKIELVGGKTNKTLRLNARVMRVEEIVFEEKYEIGLAFLKQSSEQEKMIQEIIGQ